MGGTERITTTKYYVMIQQNEFKSKLFFQEIFNFTPFLKLKSGMRFSTTQFLQHQHVFWGKKDQHNLSLAEQNCRGRMGNKRQEVRLNQRVISQTSVPSVLQIFCLSSTVIILNVRSSHPQSTKPWISASCSVSDKVVYFQ